MKDSYQDIFGELNRILIVFAHPDDMEIVCGGTVARLLNDEKKVRLVVLTNGGKGMHKSGQTEKQFGETRKAEQLSAGSELGIPKNENFNLDMPDGEIEADRNVIERIAFHIRQFQPDIIISHNPLCALVHTGANTGWVNHRDHRNVGLATFDAAYPYARDYGFFTDHFTKEKLKTHKVTKILYSDAYSDESELFFNIDDYIEMKTNALKKHVAPGIAVDADEYVDEAKHKDGYFESLGFVEIY